MEWVIVLALVALILYMLTDESFGEPMKPLVPRKRLCDYTAAGGVYEPLNKVLARGSRLYEVHVYSDEQDHPVVAKHPLNDGYDYAVDNDTFESVCVDLVNDAFPSKDPFILSIVMHTQKAVTANECAELLKTTLRRHLVSTNASVARMPIDDLANKLIVVSGGTIRGTQLEPLVNLSWMGEDLRRLSYQAALFPRDESGLVAFNRDHITLVAPETEVRTINANPDRPKYLGCQWNLYDTEGGGFVERKFLAE